MRLRVLIVLFAAACGPTRLESQDQVNNYLSRGDIETACLGLVSTNEGLRAFTAEQLAKYDHIPASGVCLCSALYDADKGTWDPAVAQAVAGSRRDDLATCLAPALSDGRVPDKTALARALGQLMAPKGFEALEKVARGTDDAELQTAAVAGLEPSDASDALIGFLGDTSLTPAVRVAAAGGLSARNDKAVVKALLGASADPAAEVRAAALEALSDDKKDYKVRDRICEAMIADDDATVRAIAVRAFKGTTDKREAQCLVDRLQKKEEDGMVREALLDAIQASPHELSSKALCNQMGPYIRMYVKDKFYDEVPGSAIIEAQNHNDFENSYDCVKRAISQGGYSCQARNYMAHWFNDLGGSATPPRCPGM